MTINKECNLTDWQAGVRPKVERLNSEFPDLTWGTYGGHHPTKDRATDGMVPGYQSAKGKARGWVAAKWAWANRKSLGIWYVIFDAKIISETDPGAGWKNYYPTAAAIRNSRDSAYHYNHVHISFYDLPAPVKYLPVYVVDPEEISTTLTANAPTGKTDQFRPPGFRITTGVKISGDWLVTEAGYAYHTDYLVLETEFQKRVAEAEKPAPEPTYLPTHYVNPETVKLAVLDRETEKVVRWLDQGHAITKATGTISIDGEDWLVDENGTRYPMHSLTTVKP